MHLCEDGHSQRVVSDTLRCGVQMADAERALFFWLENDNEFRQADLLHVPADFVSHYLAEMRAVDPMNSPSLTTRQVRIATLHSEPTRGSDGWMTYSKHLAKYEIGDELNMLFCCGDQPVAGLALFRPLGSTRFTLSQQDWEPIRTVFECMIQMHSRVRSEKLRKVLTNRHRLQAREIELVGLLLRGASNADIAETLGISVSTVKTHVVNILDKMGLHSRAEIAACASHLQFT